MKENIWYKGNFIKLYALHASFVAADTIAWSLGFLYFYKKGVPFELLLLFFLIQFGIIYLLVMNLNKLSVRSLFIYSFSIRILVLSILSAFFIKPLIYIIALLQGTAIFSYWVAFNDLYFRIPSNKNRAFLTSIYFLIIPLLGSILPAFAGAIAEKYNYSLLFLIGAITMFIPLILSYHIPNRELVFNAHAAAVRHNRIRIIVILQGVYESIPIAAIPIFVLIFIKSEFGLGLFLSYLSFAGIIGSLIIAKLSDKYNSRKIFIYPLTILLAVLIIFLGFSSDNFYIFLLIAGMLSTVNVLAAPFFITIVFDNYKNITEAVIAREAFLHLGRFFGTLIILASFVLLKDPSYAFILIGLITLLYPYFIYKRKIYSNAL